MASSGSEHLLAAKMIGLEGAKRMLEAAEEEAARNGWNVAIAVVDASGELIALHKRNWTQPASVAVATGKARTAARWKRPSKAMEDAVAGGRTALVALDDLTPMEGGLPVIVDGQVIGAIGVSGVLSSQDAQVAQAGLSALDLT